MTPEALKFHHDLHHPWLLIAPVGNESIPSIVWRSTGRPAAINIARRLGLKDWIVAKQTDTADNHTEPMAIVADKLEGILAQDN